MLLLLMVVLVAVLEVLSLLFLMVPVVHNILSLKCFQFLLTGSLVAYRFEIGGEKPAG